MSRNLFLSDDYVADVDVLLCDVNGAEPLLYIAFPLKQEGILAVGKSIAPEIT